jgi:hypothetical protein
MGTSTLSASSLMTVRLAISVMCLACDTAIVSPSPRLTCSITCKSEVPSPTYTIRSRGMPSEARSASTAATLP